MVFKWRAKLFAPRYRKQEIATRGYTNPYTVKKIDFLINYEHKVREIESICLIKSELEKRGYSVGLSNTYDEQRVNFTERRKAVVVLTPALYNNASLFAFVYRIAGSCRKVVNIQWEQVLTNRDEGDPAFFQNPKDAARDAVHLCWGEEPRRRITNAGVSSDRAIVVGPVQMDVLRPEMHGFFMSRGEIGLRFGLDTAREWVLFISSFTFVNMPLEEFETEVKCLGTWLYEFRSISITSQRETLDWFMAACSSYPEKIFVYRPHPSETADPRLSDLASKHSNFHVIHEHSVRQWILCCDKIFTWYSTAAAEVFFSGKTCSVLRPVDIPADLDVSIFRDAVMIRRLDEFLGCLTTKETDFALNAELIHQYFTVDAALPSYKIICNLLEEVYNSDRYDMPRIGTIKSAYFYLQWLRHRGFFVIKEMLARVGPACAIRKIKFIARKIDNHKALMHRMNTDREKNLASVAELEALNTITEKINCDGARRYCTPAES